MTMNAESWEIFYKDIKIGAMHGVTDHEKLIALNGEFTTTDLYKEIRGNKSALDVSRVVVYRQELEAATGHKHLVDVPDVTIKHRFIRDEKTTVYLGCYLIAIPKEYILDNLALYNDLEFLYEQREEHKNDN